MQVMQLITYKVPSADAVCANTTTLLGLYGFNHWHMVVSMVQ